MNTKHLKSYAPVARLDFIAAVTSQAAVYGLLPKEIVPLQASGDVVTIGDRVFPRGVAKQRKSLELRIREQGFSQFVEAVAYTWFNRFMAIRYMELHGYLDHGYRVLSHPDGESMPEILQHAQDVELPGLDRDQVIDLKLAGNRDEELYRLLLLAQCNALHSAMPFLFEPLGDGTELLLPDNLLHSDSLVRNLVNEIPEALWQDIEIIGWLYQFYISEKKDEVIGKVVKSEDIPAATQLFTPNWIVKYMVQNSLGAQWLATYPQSPLKGQMEYYIEPAEQTDEVNAQLAAITPSQLNPEELTLIDPASGSGHILVEAYELFKAIYLERGYRQRDVPQLILEKNLFGLDIDERAAQLTGFALMMKGRSDDRRLFERGVKLNVMALVDSGGRSRGQWSVIIDQLETLAPGHQSLATEINELVDLFEHATTFGSLIQVPEELAEKLPALKQLSEVANQDLFVSEALKRLAPLVQQAELLASQYDAVVANPPYMGGNYQTSALKKHLASEFQEFKKDVFSAFIIRSLDLTNSRGRLGFMTPYVWMFISSHEQLRERLIVDETISSLVQLEYSGFEGATVPVCTFSLKKGHIDNEKSCFVKLSKFRGAENQGPRTLEAIRNRQCGWFFESIPDHFRKIPSSQIAYWASSAMLNCFENGSALGDTADARVGLQTNDVGRFLRRWHEVSRSEIRLGCESREEAKNLIERWFPHHKGGSYRRWFGNNDWLVNWESDGAEMHSLARQIYGSPSRTIRSSEFYFRPCITWTDISSSSFGVRVSDAGHVFDIAAPCIFPSEDLRLQVAGFLSSVVAFEFLGLLNSTFHFLVSDVSSLPYMVSAISRRGDQLNKVASVAVELARADWDAYERSWDFQSLPLISGQWFGASGQRDMGDTAPGEPVTSHRTLATCYTQWVKHNRHTIAEMKRLEEENNRLFIDAYGLQDELTPDVPIEQITLTVNPAYRYGMKVASDQWSVASGFGEELETRFREDTMEELVSYAIGCMMGRYSLDVPGLVLANAGDTVEDYLRIVAEKRANLVASGQGLVTCGKEYDREQLQGSDRLAKSDGSGEQDLWSHKEVSEGGTLWTDESDSSVSGLDSVEHRRGTSKTGDSGVQELSVDRPGIAGGGGDTTADCHGSELPLRFGPEGDTGDSHRSRQDAQRSPQVPGDQSLATDHQPLTTEDLFFIPDDDGIVPLTDTEWFEDDACNRLVEFLSVAWDESDLETNLSFLAANLKPKRSESARETLRRYLSDRFYKSHLQTYKKRPIYWLFSSGKQKAFQCLVYLHRYNGGTLSRMRTEYVVPLQGMLNTRVEQLEDQARGSSSTSERKRLEKERDKLVKQRDELSSFDEQLRHYSDQRIELDLDDGVKVNYGKFGTLLAEVKAIHGSTPD